MSQLSILCKKNCFLRYIHNLFVKTCHNRAFSSLYILFCPASGMNNTKSKCLISQVEYVPFEHAMVKLGKAPDSTLASEAKSVVFRFEPSYRATLVSHIHSLQLLTPEREKKRS